MIRCLISVFISILASLFTVLSKSFISLLDTDPRFNEAFFVLFNDYFPELVALVVLIHSVPFAIAFYFIGGHELCLFYLVLFLLYTVLNIYFVLHPEVLISVQGTIFFGILPYGRPL